LNEFVEAKQLNTSFIETGWFESEFGFEARRQTAVEEGSIVDLYQTKARAERATPRSGGPTKARNADDDETRKADKGSTMGFHRTKSLADTVIPRQEEAYEGTRRLKGTVNS
jgi:hypothetical protein